MLLKEKNKNVYKGALSFEKVKNGEITYINIMKGIKNRIRFLSILSILFLKNVDKGRTVIETFFVDNDLTLIGALKNEHILSIKLISPLENTSLTVHKKDTALVG